MAMTELEKEMRECMFVANKMSEKLDFVRNKLISVYGKDITLGELEDSLWNQYTKINARIHRAFESLDK